MPKFPKPDISEISSYFIITVSSSLVAFFWALWRLSKIVPEYNWDKCLTFYLSDYYLRIRYQIINDELPEFLGAQIEATDYPEPVYHIDGECLGVVLKPFGQAFVYGLSFGLIFSAIVCAVRHTPRVSDGCCKKASLTVEKEQGGTEPTESELKQEEATSRSPLNNV